MDVKRVRKKGLANYFKKPHYEVTVEYDPAKTPLARKLNTIKAISEQYKADAGGTSLPERRAARKNRPRRRRRTSRKASLRRSKRKSR
jgi:hypothetical protein